MITIIDLLNRSITGENAPRYIIWDNRLFEYDEDEREYVTIDNKEGTCISLIDYYNESELNLCDGYDTDYQFLTKKVKIAEIKDKDNEDL